jgi:hypothetical protein
MRFRPILAAAAGALWGCGALLGIDPIDYASPDDAGADEGADAVVRDATFDSSALDAAPDPPAEASLDASARCDASGGPAGVVLVPLGVDGGGEPTFITTLGRYLVWSNNDPGGYICDPATCGADGGVLRIQHGAVPTLGLAGGGSVLALVGDQNTEHCVVTGAPIGCTNFALPMFAGKNPTIEENTMFVDALRQADAGAASIVDCQLTGVCSGPTDAIVAGTLGARTRHLHASRNDVLWVDTLQRFFSCSRTGGCSPDAGGPHAVQAPAGGVQTFDVSTGGTIVAATTTGDIVACDALPCATWRQLTRESGNLAELVVDEHGPAPEVVWSSRDGTVKSCSLTSCTCPRVLAVGVHQANHLAVTASDVFVTSTFSGGLIYRVPR